MSRAIVKEQPMTEAEAVKLAEDVVSGWVFDSTVMGVEQVKLGELKKTVAAALLAASRPGEGMIRTHEGKDLRLLGTLPVTADGCVAGIDAEVWTRPWGGAPVFRIVFFSILFAALGYNAGFDSGAIAVHSGEYVVVRLPDGTDRVVKVMRKEPPHAQ